MEVQRKNKELIDDYIKQIEVLLSKIKKASESLFVEGYEKGYKRGK